MLCEEAVAVAIVPGQSPQLLAPDAARALLGGEAVRNMPEALRARHLQAALEALPGLSPALDALARDRADALLADHRRVREAAEARGQYAVQASLPVDVLGVYVLVPAAGV